MVNYVQFTDRKREAGFTLVELAVVMIIIGLLIGGVLKGQELIANAQVAATVAQVKAFDAATTTFRDMFDAMPGDIVNPAARLPNCTAAPCNVAGNGDRRVTGGFAAAPTAEMEGFWSHLNSADLVSGVDPTRPGGGWGSRHPAAKIGGGFTTAYFNGGAALTAQVAAVAANVRAGHYLALYNTYGAAVDATGFITPNQAFRIDSKLDDGVPASGSVLAAGLPYAAPAGCAQSATVYNEITSSAACNLYIRFQN